MFSVLLGKQKDYFYRFINLTSTLQASLKLPAEAQPVCAFESTDGGGGLGHGDRSGGKPTTGQLEEPGPKRVRLAQPGNEDRSPPENCC
jgi:hypothetical protein